MASLQRASILLEDMTCPICMKILQDPVTIDCGHNFCLQCINQVRKTAEILHCPLCKLPVNMDAFRPNKLLASIAEKIQAMDPAEVQPEEEPRCQKHNEQIHYFCEEDSEFLCVNCRVSKEQISYKVTSIDEAAQNYKVQIETQVQHLGQKDKEIIKEKKECEEATQVFRAQVHLERLKILEEFKRVRQRLEEEERFLLSRLSWLEQEGVKQLEEYVTVTEGQLTTLRNHMESLKNRLQAPSMKLLEVSSLGKDSLSIYLHRDKEFEFHNPTPVPLNLKKKMSEAKARHESIIESLKKLTDNLNTEGKEDESTFLNSLDKKDKENWLLLQKNNSELPTSVPMTLDMASADPNLTFSQDLKKASLYVIDGKSNTQAKPRQLYPFHCVRGSPGLSSGCVVWEVEIQGPPGMLGIVGVVAELPQGSQIQNSEPCCLWALRISSSGCQPITNCSIQKNLPICLTKVGVYVDYDHGAIIFYDAITNKHIYTFQASFDKQVFPLFGLFPTCSSITLSP
ncbi:E3 ubiquitin-protein ligase TRIM31-like [Microtus ochrogaster]|uniref:E3 ubiquitin-protein ligase TRIM31-like n=1 Tax=Microtus ochrogaster TaxID=79684 RepID=A0ABM0L7K3_MICOH|nr:E3 ubiquitin-protein ligase TRIM31-like [Microtus ochrogaster]